MADGVHRIPLPLPNDGLRAVNVYALEDGDGLTLIDSGWALQESRERLESSLAQIGHDLGSVRRFLVTHVHRDHYSQAAVLRKLFGARVALGEGERDSLLETRSSLRSYPPKMHARIIRAGAAELAAELLHSNREPLDEHEWQEPDDWLRDGDTIEVGSRQLTVIATPGHTAGHVVFHDQNARLLFTGDHVLPSITPSIGFESAPTDTALTNYLLSLARVAALPDSMLLPAHGAVCASTAGRVAQLREHHRLRLEETQAAVSGGAGTGLEVARQLRWTRRGYAFEQLNQFNQMLAINETLAHLEELARSSEILVRVHDGVARYQ